MTHRKGHIWTVSKLDFLEAYLPAFQRACKRWWREDHANTYYVDGFSGPGRNQINGDVRKGSPLIAASVRPPFKRYFLVEKKPGCHQQLTTALDEPEFTDARARIDVQRGDFNQEVDRILHAMRDGLPAFFFLDPEGLELEWSTVEKIGRRQRADLFILISGGGVLRASSPKVPAANDSVTRFYGHERWREVLHGAEVDLTSPVGQKRFERAVDLYIEGLTSLGFTHVEQFLIATNSRNADMHALVFAAKSDVAIKIATSQIKKLIATRKGDLPSLF